MACASNQPSPLRPKAPALMSSVDSQEKRFANWSASLEQNICALGDLRLVVGFQDRQPGLAGQDQIAALAKADIGISAKGLLQPPKQA